MKPDESAWLIEAGGSDGLALVYWAGVYTWTLDSLEAVRFCRSADAERVARTLVDDDVRIVEHMWCGP